MSSAVLPSETSSGRRFVEAFASGDQHLARCLLDSLKLVDEGAFMSGLSRVLDQVLKALDGSPVGLIPLGEEPGQPTDQTSYENVDSRFIVKVVCRNLRSTHPEIVDGWGVEALRAGRVRHLVFVDDFVASGTSLGRAVQRWFEHPTIRSWHSSGYLSMHAAAYAATSRGIARARKLEIPFSAYDNSCDLWAAALRSEDVDYDDAQRLISQYGSGAKRGFGKAEGMLVLQHTVPNSLPSVFTQERGPANQPWPRLFNRQTYELTGDLQAAWPHSPSHRIQDLLFEYLPHLAATWVAGQPNENLETLLVARLVTHRKLEPQQVVQLADLPLDRVNQLLERVTLLGLDDPRQLNRELRSASSPGKHVRRDPLPKSRYYFPRFVREQG